MGVIKQIKSYVSKNKYSLPEWIVDDIGAKAENVSYEKKRENEESEEVSLQDYLRIIPQYGVIFYPQSRWNLNQLEPEMKNFFSPIISNGTPITIQINSQNYIYLQRMQ